MNIALQSPSPMRGTSSRFFSIDLIKVVGLLCIIGTHFNLFLISSGSASSPLFWCDVSYFPASQLNVAAVSAFIIVSGSGLMWSTRDRFVARTFFKKRFLAIFPLFWLSYIFVVCVGVFVSKGYSFELKLPLLLSVCAMDGFLAYKLPHYYLIGEWYMGCLLILYCLFPFLRGLFVRDRLLAFLVAALCVTGTAVYYNLSMAIERFPLSHVFSFVFGFYFITLLDRDDTSAIVLIQAMALAILYALICWIPAPAILRITSFGVVGVLFLSRIALLIDVPWVRACIGWLAMYSYGAFLLHHQLVRKILSSLGEKQMTGAESHLAFAAVVVLSFLLSVLLTNLSGIIVALVSKLMSSPITARQAGPDTAALSKR